MEKRMKIYAGIGSRRAPKNILNVMRKVAFYLAREGWTLVTGATRGADQAFAEGALQGGGRVVLWLPWRSYEQEWVGKMKRKYGDLVTVNVLRNDDRAAFESVFKYHPNPDALTRGVQKLHARNYRVVKGVRFIVCWTPNGEITGGTGQALRIAMAMGIPIRNLGKPEYLKKILKWIDERGRFSLQKRDIWSFVSHVDAICITTNGFVKRNGAAVMGRGTAFQAKKRFYGIDYALGNAIRKNGNVVQVIWDDPTIVAFPVKPVSVKFDGHNVVSHAVHQFRIGDVVPGFLSRADIAIIERSLKQLVDLANKRGWRKVVLPMPGTGAGELDPDDIVPLLEKYLDSRFIVVYL